MIDETWEAYWRAIAEAMYPPRTMDPAPRPLDRPLGVWHDLLEGFGCGGSQDPADLNAMTLDEWGLMVEALVKELS